MKPNIKKIAGESPVTGFNDYRSWLREIYSQAKGLDPSYSYSKLSNDLGLSSSNAHLVISGKRDLTLRTSAHIVKALNLAAKQKKYLEALVNYEHAKSSLERDKAFKTILKLKTKTLETSLDKNQLAFFTHWYHAAILEMLRITKTPNDPEWVSARLTPQVSVPNVKKALKLLNDLGYAREVDGHLFATDEIISTGDQVQGLAINSFHSQMIELGKGAITTHHSSEREISSITVAMPKDLKAQLEKELIALRKKYLNLASKSDKLEEVVQLNFQLFSLTKNTSEDGSTS